MALCIIVRSHLFIMSNVCLLLFFLQDVMTWYHRFVRLLQLWTALGSILIFLWPAGAVIHHQAQAMVEAFIPSAVQRLWELWGLLLNLWEQFH